MYLKCISQAIGSKAMSHASWANHSAGEQDIRGGVAGRAADHEGVKVKPELQ